MKYLLTAFFAIVLSACSALTVPVELASNVILVSDSIDSMQTELGEYSTNQDALDDLDELQADIKELMTTGDVSLDTLTYQTKALVIYNTLKSEVQERWDELSETQQNALIEIDEDLIEINTTIDELQLSDDSGSSIITLLYQATTLMSFYDVL